MKTCKTCKHSQRVLFDWSWKYTRCRRGEHYRIDPVSGKKSYMEVFCNIERKYSGYGVYCGPEGTYWEAK